MEENERPEFWMLTTLKTQVDVQLLKFPKKLIMTDAPEDSIIDMDNGLSLNSKQLPKKVAYDFTLIPMGVHYEKNILKNLYKAYEKVLKPSPYIGTHITAANDVMDAVKEAFRPIAYVKCETKEDFYNTVLYISDKLTEETAKGVDHATWKPDYAEEQPFQEQIDFEINHEKLKAHS